MIRVVIDTNVVISATLRSGGLPEAVFNLAVNRRVQLCVSEAILAEYEEVLRRPRLNIRLEKVAVALTRIREAAVCVAPAATVTACSDPDDNIFLDGPRRTTSLLEMPPTSQRNGPQHVSSLRGSSSKSSPDWNNEWKRTY